MGGSTKKIDTTPQATQKIRGDVIDFLMGKGGADSPYNRMFAQQANAPDAVQVGIAGPVASMFNSGIEPTRGMVRDVDTQFSGGGMGPMARTRFLPGQVQGGGAAPMVQTAFDPGVPGFRRTDIRDVNGQPVGVGEFAPQAARDVAAGATQSVDQLGGASSPFMQNILSQTQPLFDQQRALALAQAKEASGNLTGSGYANALGNSLNRLVPQQQAQLAQYATQAMGLEQQRQQQDAARALQAGQANQAADLALGGQRLQQGGLALQGAQIGQQGQLANQQADQNFLSQLLGQGGLNLQGQQLGLQGQLANQGVMEQMFGRGLQAQLANQQAGLEAQRLGLQGQGMNQQAFSDAAARALQAQQLGLQSQGMNQGADLQFIQQLLAQNGLGLQAQELGLRGQMANQQNQQGAYNLQSQLDAARNAMLFGGQQANNQQNAQLFAQLLGGQSLAGVGPSQVVKSGGIGSLLGPIAQGIGGFIGSGGNPLGALSGLFGGGSPNIPAPIYQPLPSNFPQYQYPF